MCGAVQYPFPYPLNRMYLSIDLPSNFLSFELVITLAVVIVVCYCYCYCYYCSSLFFIVVTRYMLQYIVLTFDFCM